MKVKLKNDYVQADYYEFGKGIEDGCEFYLVSGKYVCTLNAEEIKKGIPKCNRKPFILMLGKRHYLEDGEIIVTINENNKFVINKGIFQEMFKIIE